VHRKTSLVTCLSLTVVYCYLQKWTSCWWSSVVSSGEALELFYWCRCVCSTYFRNSTFAGFHLPYLINGDDTIVKIKQKCQEIVSWWDEWSVKYTLRTLQAHSWMPINVWISVWLKSLISVSGNYSQNSKMSLFYGKQMS
jgi:hypothetical protein